MMTAATSTTKKMMKMTTMAPIAGKDGGDDADVYGMAVRQSSLIKHQARDQALGVVLVLVLKSNIIFDI